MSEFGSTMSQYATPEVMTVLAAIAVLAVGWKLASGTVSVVGSFAKKASFAGLMSTLLIASGLGSMGLGIGEIGSRSYDTTGPVENGVPHVGFTNEDLMTIIENPEVNENMFQLAIEYARTRDGHVPAVDEADVLKLISKQDDPEVVAAIVKLYENRRTRIDEQYATLTAKPEPVEAAPAKEAKPLYDLVSTEVLAEGEMPAETDQPFDIVAVDEAEITNPDSMMSLPMAWLSVLIGLGMTVSGGVVFGTRNNKRNPHDPHYNQVA